MEKLFIVISVRVDKSNTSIYSMLNTQANIKVEFTSSEASSLAGLGLVYKHEGYTREDGIRDIKMRE